MPGVGLFSSARARLGVVAIAALVAAAALLPSGAHASGCENSWTNTSGGSWTEGSNWSAGHAPGSAEEACITEPGTYTVTAKGAAISVKALTVGGASGTQSLAVATSNGVGDMHFATSSGLKVEAHGAVVLTNGESSGYSAYLEGPVTNGGSITTEHGTGGGRYLQGSIVNKGAIKIHTTSEFNGKERLLTNEGTLNVETASLVTGAGSSVTNGTGGAVLASGSGVLSLNGGTYTQGAGTTSTGGVAVYVDHGAVDYTGAGESSVAERGTSTLEGNLSSGQKLSVQTNNGEGNVVVTLNGNVSSGGAITLTNGESGAYSAYLTIPAADTLTNTGTITTEQAAGGGRHLQGKVVNHGTVKVNATTELEGAEALLTNEGTLNVESASLLTSGGSSVTNGSGGMILASASGDVYMKGGKYTQGAGTTSTAQPAVYVASGTLDYTGAGEGSVAVRGTDTLEGNLAAGQKLSVQTDNSAGDVHVTLSGNVSSGGAITLTNGESGGYSAYLTVPSGDTLTNTGSITTEPANGGARHLQGNVVNKGTIKVNASSTQYDGAKGLLTNEGTLNVEAATLSTGGESSVTNGAGGSILASSKGVLVMNSGTLTEGAGTTSTGEPAAYMKNGTITYTGGGASSLAARGTDTLTGGPSGGQLLSIQTDNSAGDVHVTLSGNVSSGGAITLTNGESGGYSAYLTVPSGDTLTNTGSITTELANGGNRHLQGNVVNKGTITVNTSNTQYDGAKGLLTNEGTLNVQAATLSTGGESSVTNGAGGSILASAKGDLFMNGGTFTQGAGTTSTAQPAAYLKNGAIAYVGAGASSIAVRGSDTLSGPIKPGQTLSVQTDNSTGDVHVTAAASFTNEGTIVLTNGESSGFSAFLKVTSAGTGTLTDKKGTIVSETAAGGSRTIEGNVKNEGTVTLGPGRTLHVTGTYTQAGTGTLKVGDRGTSYGVLSAGGAVKLAGAIVVAEEEAFSHNAGEAVTIVTGPKLSGTFADLDAVLSSAPGLWYQPSYTATSATLTLTQAALTATPSEGPGGTKVMLKGTGFAPKDKVKPAFVDAKNKKTAFTTVTANAGGEFTLEVTVPASAAKGAGTFSGPSGIATGLVASTPFTVK